MEKMPDRALSTEPAEIRVVLLFDTTSAAQRANRLLDCVRARVNNGLHFEIRRWSSADFEQPSAWAAAYRDLTQAHLLVVAADKNPELMTALRRWMPTPGAVEQAERAMIALVDYPARAQSEDVRNALAQFACEKGFHFLKPAERSGLQQPPERKN